MVLFVQKGRARGIDPATGDILWRYTFEGTDGAPMVQPQVIDETSVIVPLADSFGVSRINVELDSSDAWQVREEWSTRDLKPSFNDFVYSNGAIFGFDKMIYGCIDADTGGRTWKRGRYGFGQTLLLSEASQLLVLSERGQLHLVDASKEDWRELASISVLSSKTWNHPAVADRYLYVRNSEEMVCYQLQDEPAPRLAGRP